MLYKGIRVKLKLNMLMIIVISLIIILLFVFCCDIMWFLGKFIDEGW